MGESRQVASRNAFGESYHDEVGMMGFKNQCSFRIQCGRVVRKARLVRRTNFDHPNAARLDDLGNANLDRLPAGWEYNNFRLAIDTDANVDQSWWHGNLEEQQAVAMARFLSDEIRDGKTRPEAEIPAASRS